MYRAGAFVFPAAAVWPAVELVFVPGAGGILIVSVAMTPVFGGEAWEDELPVADGEAELQAARASPMATAAIPAAVVCRVVVPRAKSCVPATAARYGQSPGAT